MIPKKYEEIELLVLSRETDQVAAKIRLLEASILASEDVGYLANCLRRVGLVEAGFALLRKSLGRAEETKNRDLQEKVRLWLAKFLYSLGSTKMALRILHEATLPLPERHQLEGELRLAEFDFRSALECFSRVHNENTLPTSDPQVICYLAFLDAKVGNGEIEAALELVRKLKAACHSDYLRSVVTSCEAEYLVRQEQFPEALLLFEREQDVFFERIECIDSALFKKWYGYSLCRTSSDPTSERLEKGASYLRQAYAFFKSASMRPEAWLDILRLELELGLHDASKFESIAEYPGLGAGFRRLFQKTSENFDVGSSEAELQLDIGAEEFLNKDRWVPGLDKSHELLALLARADRFGIHRVRALDLLWPDEVHSFQYLGKRLENLVFRLKETLNIDVESAESWMMLTPASRKRVRVYRTENPQPNIFTKYPEPSVPQICEFYDVSRAQAYKMKKNWP